MKKLLFIISALAIFSNSFSQIKYGPKAGLNIANLTGDDTDGLDSRTSITFGAFARVHISETFAFQPELLYSGQGFTGSDVMDGIKIEATAKLDYLNIPFMFKYYAENGFNIQAGPQIGYLLSAKTKAEANQQGVSITAEEDVKSEFKTFDFGMNIGLGYDLKMGLGMDIRYTLGLTNIPDYDDAKAKNGVISLVVSYAF